MFVQAVAITLYAAAGKPQQGQSRRRGDCPPACKTRAGGGNDDVALYLMANSGASGSPATTQVRPELLQNLLETISDGVIALTPDGKIRSANPAALTMHGCDTLADLGGSAKEYDRRFDLRFRDGRLILLRHKMAVRDSAAGTSHQVTDQCDG